MDNSCSGQISLPDEIWIMILLEALPRETKIDLIQGSDKLIIPIARQPIAAVRILAVNKFLYHEGRKILYGSNTFDFYTFLEGAKAVEFIDRLSLETRQLIRKVKLSGPGHRGSGWNDEVHEQHRTLYRSLLEGGLDAIELDFTGAFWVAISKVIWDLRKTEGVPVELLGMLVHAVEDRTLCRLTIPGSYRSIPTEFYTNGFEHLFPQTQFDATEESHVKKLILTAKQGTHVPAVILWKSEP